MTDPTPLAILPGNLLASITTLVTALHLPDRNNNPLSWGAGSREEDRGIGGHVGSIAFISIIVGH